MNAHELARMLLAGPNLPVVMPDGKYHVEEVGKSPCKVKVGRDNGDEGWSVFSRGDESTWSEMFWAVVLRG